MQTQIQHKLSQVAKGMEVYDKDGAFIGIVSALRLGEGPIKSGETNMVTVVDAISETIGDHKDLATAFYIHLYEKGFACVNRGLFRSDVVVFPDQIDDIGEAAIFLNVERSQLVKV